MALFLFEEGLIDKAMFNISLEIIQTLFCIWFDMLWLLFKFLFNRHLFDESLALIPFSSPF